MNEQAIKILEEAKQQWHSNFPNIYYVARRLDKAIALLKAEPCKEKEGEAK